MKNPTNGNIFDFIDFYLDHYLLKKLSNLILFYLVGNQDKEDEMCPLCKSTKYLNPKMVLLVSPCYHRLCETCINRLFLHGSAPCPLCATILRKGNFVVPIFTDLKVEKEIRIRKIVSKAYVYFLALCNVINYCFGLFFFSFYKREEDFDNLKDYNDYLEEVEDIVFNLANDVNVQSTYARLESFKTDNRDTLEKNLARQAHEQRQLQVEEEAERLRKEDSKKYAEMEIEKEQIELIHVKKKLINDLVSPKFLNLIHIYLSHYHF